jgi:hypothetical protein
LFGAKSAGRRTPPTPELKKSAKFFDRVDQRHALNPPSSRNKDASKRKVKQATLLDFAAKKNAAVGPASGSAAPEGLQNDHQ